MPVTVQGPDGNTYQFPDGTDKAAAVAYFKKKGVGAPKLEPHGDLRPLTQRERFTMTYPVGAKGEGVGENLHNMAQNAGVGIFQTADAIVHPLRTGKAILDSLNPKSDAPNPLQATYEGLNTRPGETISNAAGQAIATAGAGEAAGAIVNGARRVIPAALRKGTEILTNTTPKVTAELSKGTAEENATAAAKAAEKNTANTQTHLEKTQEALHETAGREMKYQQDVKAAEQEAATKRAEATRKAIEDREKALRERKQAEHSLKADKAKQEKATTTAEKLKAAWGNLRAGIETAREKALQVGNEKYSGVNEKLSGLQADPEAYENALAAASESLRGSKSEPTLLSQMSKKWGQGEVPTYADLQGDYSALGKELSKGTLPGDVFHAYDELHEALGADMQRIADSQGLGAQLVDARNYWRRMKQTFGKPIGEADAATKALSTSDSTLASDAQQANRIRLLGSFDPDIPQLFSHVANIQKGVDSLPKPVSGRVLTQKADAPPIPPRKPVATAPPPKPVAPPERVAPPDRPAEVVPETKTLSMEDIRGAKGEALAKRADAIRNKGGGWANTFVILDGIRNAIHGNIGGIGTDIAVRGTFGVGKAAIANLLEKPGVIKFLTEPTPRDIAQIPVGMRGDLRMVVEQARQKGIKVNPSLLLVTGASGIASPRQ